MLLLCAAVQHEADALPDEHVLVTGIGRVNAAAAVTRAIIAADQAVTGVVNIGIAGALPDGGLAIGDLIVGRASVYAEEGLITPSGFQTMDEMGFTLGPVTSNAITPPTAWLDALRDAQQGFIATVATCSGTNDAAVQVAARTGARAEAMEGAAVLHAAALAGLPAVEIRAISNTTGDRGNQQWDVAAALRTLEVRVPLLLAALRTLI